ncbi:MAG: SPOR domain-containing protein [Caulobacteraceae bacterium]
MSTSRRDLDPPERPLAFDGREAAAPRRGPAPVSLMVSLIVLAAVGGGVFYLYRGGVRSPSGPPEPVGVPIRDIRVAAPPQPQTPDPASGLTIYKDMPGATPPAPTFVAPPEQPTPRPGAPAQEVAVAPLAGPIAAVPISGGVPVASAKATPAKPVKTASIDSLLAANAASGDKAAPSVAPAPAVKPAAAAKPDATSAKASRFVVQIGAFSSQALADKSWSSAAGIAPSEMAGKGKHVAAMTKGGATLYRVAVTGFDTHAAAEAMCAKLTAAGRNCFVR